MPQRNPVLIAREYVQPGEPPQVRKNALSALATLGGTESWGVLTEVALVDTDPSVRERAETELSSLTPDSAARAIEPLFGDLDVDARKEAAYSLLGRLRNRGLSFTFPRRSLGSRLSLARKTARHLTPSHGWTFFFRAWKGGVTGAVAAWILLMLYCVVLIDAHVEMATAIAYLIVLFVICPLLAIPATNWTPPIRCYADTLGGLLLDMAVAAAVGGLWGLVVALAITRTEGGMPHRHWLLVAVLPVAAAAVRFGTVAFFGRRRAPAQNVVLQMVGGFGCGTLVIHLALLMSSGTNEPFNTSWAGVVIAAGALAGTYAWIDRKSTPIPVVRTRVAILAGLMVVASFLVPMTALLPPRISIGHEGGADLSADLAFPEIASEFSWAKVRARRGH